MKKKSKKKSKKTRNIGKKVKIFTISFKTQNMNMIS